MGGRGRGAGLKVPGSEKPVRGAPFPQGFENQHMRCHLRKFGERGPRRQPLVPCGEKSPFEGIEGRRQH